MNPQRIAVVGAGWAGLAAAIDLQDAGHEVTVLELRHHPGGRARQLPRAKFQAPIDNGQHILLGAYRHTLGLMQRLGCSPQEKFWRMPLTLRQADGSFHLHTPHLPSPWHALWGLATARGLALAEKTAALRFVRHLKARRWLPEGEITVAELLHQHRQPHSLVLKLWHPLCLAALNTPIERASAVLFCRVLGDSLDAGRQASDMLLPRTHLGALWPEAAASKLNMQYGRQVRSVLPSDNDVQVDGATFDAVVLAVPPYMVSRMLARLTGSTPLIQQLTQFQYAPIATLTLQLAAPMAALPSPVLMLQEDRERDLVGHWLFDRTRLFKLKPERPELTIVSSQNEAIGRLSRSELVQRLHTQAAEQVALPPVAEAELIIEKRATFESTPGLTRPQCQTPWPRVVLAGDYTDTGYPAVLEGAVISGQNAAATLLKTLG